MLPRPPEFEGLDPAQFHLTRAPIASVENMLVPHHYEAFLNHPDFCNHAGEKRGGGWVIAKCADTNRTGWFDMLAVELALCELHGSPTTPLSVNVSPASACNPHFLNQMEGMLADHSAVVGNLTLELTENAHHIPNHWLYDFVYKAQDRGVHVYLDDIGRGRFAIEHIDPILLDLCDGVKFAGGYVGDAVCGSLEGRATRRVMRHFADEAYRMGKEITVEGVRNLDCLKWLVREGVPFDYVQPSKRATLQDIVTPRAEQSSRPQAAAG